MLDSLVPPPTRLYNEFLNAVLNAKRHPDGRRHQRRRRRCTRLAGVILVIIAQRELVVLDGIRLCPVRRQHPDQVAVADRVLVDDLVWAAGRPE
jgi:hypothetical protein